MKLREGWVRIGRLEIYATPEFFEYQNGGCGCRILSLFYVGFTWLSGYCRPSQGDKFIEWRSYL